MQEKIDIDNMVCIKNKHLDKLYETDRGKDIIKGLKKSENKDKLTRFLKNAEKLAQKGFIIDTIGDNLFFGFDEAGKLEITLLDYGCGKTKYSDNEKNKENIKDTKDLIKKLKELI